MIFLYSPTSMLTVGIFAQSGAFYFEKQAKNQVLGLGFNFWGNNIIEVIF